MYLIFDSTPISKPGNFKALFNDVDAWPRMVHLSWILLGEDLKPIEDFDCIIQPEGYKITPAVLKYAQLEDGEIERRGEKLDLVLDQFSKSADKAEYILSLIHICPFTIHYTSCKQTHKIVGGNCC